MERANQVFTLRRVHAGFSADRTIDLGKQGRWNLHAAHAAAQYGGGEPRQISDDPAAGADHRLAAVVEDGACTGFRIGDTHTTLGAAERSLMGAPLEGDGVTAWMAGMKRVGFLRLLEAVAEGRGAHPLDLAVEDTLVDYYLEKLGRYVSTPVTSPYSPLTRLGLRLMTRLSGG